MPAGRAEVLGGAYELALAQAAPAVPQGQDWQTEPKWDSYLH